MTAEPRGLHDMTEYHPITMPLPARRYTDVRADPRWRPYLAATIRLRRCNAATPRQVMHTRMARALDLEGEIMRATGAGFDRVFDAGETDADEIVRRCGRWMP